MARRHPKWLIGVFSGVLAAVALAGAGPTATAEEQKPTAIVSLGDSFISGEAAGDYEDSNGCHRSANAEIHRTGLAVDTTINLACSGAKIENVLHAPFKGEDGQLDRLVADVLPKYDVEMIAVTVIANNVGFADIVVDCALGYLGRGNPCHHEWRTKVPERLQANQPHLVEALSQIRAALDAAGQQDTQLVLQSYASPINRELRYSSYFSKLANGCPYYSADARWAYDEAVPQFSRVMRVAAARAGVRYLDLNRSFAGRELCAPGARASNEWVRGIWLVDLQNSMHPLGRGHRAIGACLGQFTRADYREGHCQRSGETLTVAPGATES